MHENIPIIGQTESTEVISIDELSRDKFYHITANVGLENAGQLQGLLGALKQNDIKAIVTGPGVVFEDFNALLGKLSKEQANKIYETIYGRATILDTEKHEQSK